MNTQDITRTLTTLFAELVDGAGRRSYMLNDRDIGLLASLDKISAADASKPHAGGAPIAAHVDHLRYGLSLMNRWAAGEQNAWAGADWTAAWRTRTVSDDDWTRLRESLRDEAHRWLKALGTPREVNGMELSGVIGSIAHLAYHLGAIRQIDRATRGPTAEDDAESKRTASDSDVA